MTKRPEILAPGGSIQAVETALANGADAVYLGVGNLNARSRAGNLTQNQLPGIVEYVHSFGSRIYVTLNIPVTTLNLKETARTIAVCHQSGVDALIVRDPVVMKAARLVVGDMPLHASTQAGVHSVETAARMARLGCTRVILARECSKKDILAIRKALPELELEVFVFGAMCFGISGMCLMGHAVSGRSGNHGSCCQPCRLPYFSKQGDPAGYVFSMKDLDLVPHVRELHEMGVAAFKIEGRLKTPSWTGCVTRWLKTAVDRPSPGLTPEEYSQFNRDVSVLYSRPRTDGYFTGDTDASTLLSTDNQTHTGLDAGKFSARQDHAGTRVSFRTPVDINIRDGLLIKTSDRTGGSSWTPVGIRSITDGRGRNAIRVAAGREVTIPIGPEFNKNQISGVYIHSADSVRARYRKVERPVPGQIKDGELPWPVFETVDLGSESIAVRMSRGRFSYRTDSPISSEPARSGGLDPARLKKYFGDADFKVEPGLFVNPSVLKEIRREFVARFEASLAENHEKLADNLRETMSGMAEDFQTTDQELIERGGGTVAISRVTGMTPGTFYTSAGDGFLVEPGESSTRVRKA